MAKKVKSSGSWLSLFSFVAVMLLGLGITISVVLGKFFGVAEIAADWIKNIAIAIGLIVPLLYSYRTARKYGLVWFVLWIIAVILIVVFYILGIAL